MCSSSSSQGTLKQGIFRAASGELICIVKQYGVFRCWSFACSVGTFGYIDLPYCSSFPTSTMTFGLIIATPLLKAVAQNRQIFSYRRSLLRASFPNHLPDSRNNRLVKAPLLIFAVPSEISTFNVTEPRNRQLPVLHCSSVHEILSMRDLSQQWVNKLF